MYKVALTSLATLRPRVTDTETGGFTEAERNQLLAHLDSIFQSPILPSGSFAPAGSRLYSQCSSSGGGFWF
jgi:hypothetical protein